MNDSELLDAQQLLNRLIEDHKIASIISQKLQLLQLSLMMQEIDTQTFDLLTEESCEALIKLSHSAKKAMFIEIISQLAKENNLASSMTEVVDGVIDVKTKTLGRWKNKRFILHMRNKTFEIPRANKKGKAKQKKPDRIIDLPHFELIFVKPKDARFRFKLETSKKGAGYYKALNLGTTDQKIYTILLEYLKRICELKGNFPQLGDESLFKGKATGRQSEALPRQEIAKQRYNTSMANPRTDNLSQSEIQTSTPQKREGKSPQPTSIKEEPKEYEESKPQINPQLLCIHNNDVPNPLEETPRNQGEKSPSFKQQDVQIEERLEKKETQQEKQDKQTPPQKKKETIRVIISPPEEDLDPRDKKLKQEKQKQEDQRKKIQEQNQSQQQQQNQSTSVVKLSMDDDEFFDISEERVPHFFSKIQESGKLDYQYLSESLPSTVSTQVGPNYEIHRSTINPLLFRATLSIEGVDIERVFQAFAELEFSKKWNGNINSNDSKYVQLIANERSVIIYEKRKQYGLFYLPRDYVYLRHVYERSGDLFIIDKSIQSEDCPIYTRVIRAEINYQVIRIQRIGEKIWVTIETETTNGGFSSTEQDGAITQVYFNELKNVQEFLNSYQQEELIQSPLLSSITVQKEVKRRKTSIIQMPPVIFAEVSQESDETPKQQIPEELSLIPQISQEEQFEQIQVAQRRLSFLPDSGTYKVQKQDKAEEEKSEVKVFEKLEQNDHEDLDQADYVPSQVMLSTAQAISSEYKEMLTKQIKQIESEAYFNYCLNHKYFNEPLEVKQHQYLTEMEGGHFFLKKDWERDTKNGGLLFINPKKTEAQKRVIKFMLKKIGSNLVTGKSILSISLPVEIFETRSNLERFAYAFSYAPKYLEEGAKQSTPEQQMKMSITFGLSAIIMYLSLEKPFNPILGETYQGYVDGCPIYVEQISHHPPICSFQMYGRGYKVDGHIETVANMNANSVQGKNVGYLRITYYNTGAVHDYMMVPGIFSGTTFGDRVFNMSGKGLCIDVQNLLIWEGIFDPPRASMFSKKVTPMDYFMGGIYRVKQHAIQKYKKEGYAKYSGLDLNKDIVEKLNNVQGVWNEYMEIDGQQTWNLQMNPLVMTNHTNPLPSDSFYRLDILHWKLKDFDNSQKSKEVLEIKQRNDRKLREKHSGKKH